MPRAAAQEGPREAERPAGAARSRLRARPKGLPKAAREDAVGGGVPIALVGADGRFALQVDLPNEGEVRFALVAIDAAGNRSAPASFAVSWVRIFGGGEGGR